MNKAFTLLELLVVVAIMGLLGTASVGGYRQMQRGLEERRVVDNASKFLTLAAERAQIDRQLVAVYYWNEMLRDDSQDDASQLVVGKAVAVRRQGRLTSTYQGYLIDEFGDFERYEANGQYELEHSTEGNYKIKFYRMDTPASMDYTTVDCNPQAAVARPLELYLNSDPMNANDGLEPEEGGQGKLQFFGYVAEGAGSWKVGSAYGFEFQSIELAPGYIFGSSLPSSISSPVTSPQAIVFEPNANGSLPSGSVPVRAVRQSASGSYTTVNIGTATVETN